MFKNKTENNVKEFPKELSQVILDGQKHGVGDELMIKGMVSVGRGSADERNVGNRR